jgi:hypothetical protein
VSLLSAVVMPFPSFSGWVGGASTPSSPPPASLTMAQNFGCLLRTHNDLAEAHDGEDKFAAAFVRESFAVRGLWLLLAALEWSVAVAGGAGGSPGVPEASAMGTSLLSGSTSIGLTSAVEWVSFSFCSSDFACSMTERTRRAARRRSVASATASAIAAADAVAEATFNDASFPPRVLATSAASSLAAVLAVCVVLVLPLLLLLLPLPSFAASAAAVVAAAGGGVLMYRQLRVYVAIQPASNEEARCVERQSRRRIWW